MKIKPPLRTLPAAPNPPAFSYLVTIRLVLCLAFIFAESPLQAQSSRKSDQDDINVEVNIYEGEDGGFLGRRPLTSYRGGLANRLIKGESARLMATDPEYLKFKEQSPEAAAELWREATTQQHILAAVRECL